MEGWNFWWGIAAFFLGGLATQLNGWLAYRRQRKDRADDAQDALRQRREEFELQHLVEVNQLLRDLMAGLVLMATAARLEHQFPGAFDDEELTQRFQEGMDAVNATEAALTAQAGFILDDGIRAHVKGGLVAYDEASVEATEPETVNAALSAVGTAMRPAYEAIAARVRELYAGRAGA
ncbi:hypothetical protein [Streptomyces sp. NPDC050416]|uniref:hypothetical protein n=1 Tax=Streptomyces sp. NPDC050416 TaxID=3365611 RepID=UPI0037A1CED5